MNESIKRIKQIEIENIIWLIYIFIIGLCLYANSFEKNYFETGNKNSKETYRKLTITIFTIAIIVYIYFFIDSYDDLKNINQYTSQRTRKLNNLSFIGTTFILLSGIIFLYIAIVDKDLDIELAFN